MDVVRHEAVPGRPYAAAVVAEGRFVFVSGQIPVRDGRLIAGTMREQTRAVMDNIVAILDSAGATLGDVVRCGVFLGDLTAISEFNEEYASRFGSRLPARTTIGADLPGYLVEIDCIALLPAGARR